MNPKKAMYKKMHIKNHLLKNMMQVVGFKCGSYWIRTSDPLLVRQVL
jgi:hypothetical protein